MSEEIKLDLSQVSFNNLIDDKAPAPVLEQEVAAEASVPEEAENSLPEAEVSEESVEEQTAEVSEPEKIVLQRGGDITTDYYTLRS